MNTKRAQNLRSFFVLRKTTYILTDIPYNVSKDSYIFVS